MPNRTVLALGAEMKSAPCLATPEEFFACEDTGDLGNPENYRSFVTAVEKLLKICDGNPDVVAVDMHPMYTATKYAARLSAPVFPVQHHHAHIVSCMADRGVSGSVLGIACDGTGYGTDGAIWGCELLACDVSGFARIGHLGEFPLPGGDSAAIETWRPAASLLAVAAGTKWFESTTGKRIFGKVDPEALSVTLARLGKPAALAKTTSLGRLFDAAAFISGLCDRNITDACAPVALQRAAEMSENHCHFTRRVYEKDGVLIMDQLPMIMEMADAAATGESPGSLALGFHISLAEMIADAAAGGAEKAGIKNIMLSGGCFLNWLLTETLAEKLGKAGLQVYTHDQISTGDAGIAVGQAIAAACSDGSRVTK